MQIRWSRLPFAARNRAEFSRGLTDWLGRVFCEALPARGYEIREEQIYTAFRMARALAGGTTLAARRHYRAAGDLIVTDHRLFAPW